LAITNMLPSIWSARILAKLEKNLVFAQPGVVNRDYEGDIRADGDRVHIHSFNDLTVAAPPGIVMVAPLEIPRNAQPGNVRAALNSPGKRTKKRGHWHYKGRSPKAPSEVLEELQ
jgi:hypothetical protein